MSELKKYTVTLVITGEYTTEVYARDEIDAQRQAEYDFVDLNDLVNVSCTVGDMEEIE